MFIQRKGSMDHCRSQKKKKLGDHWLTGQRSTDWGCVITLELYSILSIKPMGPFALDTLGAPRQPPTFLEFFVW